MYLDRNNYIDKTAGSTFVPLTAIAGESITAGKIVFVKEDGKVYVSSSSDVNKNKVTGIALNSGNANDTIKIQTGGVYQTTGLTANTVYYLGTNGALSTTAGAWIVGVARSTTELYLIIKNVYLDSAVISSEVIRWAVKPSETIQYADTTEESTTSGSYTTLKSVRITNIKNNSTIRTKISITGYGNYRVYGQIWRKRDGVETAVSDEHTLPNATGWYQYVDNLSGWNDGDEILVKIKGNGGYTVGVKDFYVCFDYDLVKLTQTG